MSSHGLDKYDPLMRRIARTDQVSRRSTPQNVDPRHGYDLMAAQYAARGTDPYSEQVAFYQQMGRRYPEPYAAQAAELAVQRLAYRDIGYADIGPRHAVYSAADIAGQRMTQFGGMGVPGAVFEENHSTARQWFGYAPMGYRDAGSIEQWDIGDYRRRTSGRVDTRRKFDQQIFDDRPWLMLRAIRGSAAVRVTVGLSNGGAETARTFFLGGGFTAGFYLPGYEDCQVNVIALETATTEVHFAWVRAGSQANDLTLYYPERLTIPVGGQPVTATVPEGAYAVVAETADAAWAWNNPLVAGHIMTTGVAAGVVQEVLGSTYTYTQSNDVVWFLRSI